MAEIGIMIEGQEGLTWEKLFRIAGAVEALGFGALFRSDHLTALNGAAQRPSLALWPSLTALAMRTTRIRFGPMVCPITFRHPAMLAKMAIAVSELSNGRLDLGIGAGWYGDEHAMLGIHYPRYGVRLQMLDEAAHVIKALWSGRPTTFNGQHYQLKEAETHPTPQNLPHLIMGGKGKKTLQIVARHASEWNCSYVGIDVFRQKWQELAANCAAIGRDPATMSRSLMVPFVIGRDETAVQKRIDAHRAIFSDLPADFTAWRAAGFPGGSPQQLTDQLHAFAAAGIQRFMLQHNDLDDLDSLELLAAAVLPHFN